MQQKAFAAWKIIALVCLILAVVFGGYLGLAWILRKVNGEVNNPNSNQTTTKSTENFDKNLVGTWESDCLVPDQESKWAEKHKFVINKDGTATHTRLDWALNDCTTLQPTGTITDQFKLTIPLSGKINLAFVSTENTRMTADQISQYSGKTIYDIYQVSAGTLEFGHGFRGDNLAYSSKTGGSENDRFDSLNAFIVYRKK